MTGGARLIDDVRAALQPHGLFLRGTVNFTGDEMGPVLEDGRPAAGLVLIGNIGGSLWTAFDRWRTGAGSSRHPLDDWSKAVIRPLAERFGATPFFPSDPPYQPFQQWATRAEGLRASPLGILIHPEYGLWHGYRAALAFGHALSSTGNPVSAHPCDECREKPCLSTCPADAVKPERFDVARCRDHLASPEGAPCMEAGCLARNACPIGASYCYPPGQLVFHMKALMG